MPLKLNVGLNRKVGEPNYGSRGASVNMELEVDSSLVAEPARLHERIRQIFTLVRTSLAEELNGHHQANSSNGQAPQTNGTAANHSNGNGNGHQEGSQSTTPRPATQSQIKALYAITRSQQLDLKQLLQDRFQVQRCDALTLKQASQLIDELKKAENRGGQ